MAINLGQILNIVNYFTDVSQEGGRFTSVQFNTLLPKAVNDTYNLFVYKEYEKEQKFTDAAMPFKVFMGQEAYTDNNGNLIPAIPPLMIDASGYANIPSDYKHYSAIKFKKLENTDHGVEVKIKNVMVLTDQEFDSWQDSVLKKGTFKYPFCNFQNGFIRFAPKELKQVNFVYLRYPKTPVYGYTTNTSTQVDTYNPATSVEVEFRDEEIYKLISLLLSYVGVNLSYSTIADYAAQEQQKNLAV